MGSIDMMAKRRCLVLGADAASRDVLAADGWTIEYPPESMPDVMLVVGGLDAIAPARAVSAAPMLLQPPPGFTSDDRAAAFAMGAGDVLPHPHGPAELLARLSALCRRGLPPIRCGDLAIDPVARAATRDGRPIALLPREYALLHHLAGEGGRIVSRSSLLERVWKLGFDPQTNVVEVHMSRLRAKLDRGHPAPLLHTVRGRGYALAESPPID